MIDQELERIDTILARAIQHIESGELKKAGRLSSSLSASFAVNEATRAQSLINGFVLVARQKRTQAKKLCLQNICYLWDNPNGLFLIRQPHAHVTDKSHWYEILVKGGSPQLGIFTQFTEVHSSSFLVLADDEFEALTLIDEIAHYTNPEGRSVEVIASRSLELETQTFDRRGVYRCLPFSLELNRSPRFIVHDEIRV